MKAMRKIFPALCMLLVSAVMLGSSTFAWFSSNSKVTASGMQISVSTPTSLFISTESSTDASKFSNSATFALESGWGTNITNGVMPTTIKTGTAGAIEFKKLNDEALKKVPESGAYTPNDDELIDGKADVFFDKFWLKVAGEDSAAAKAVYFKLTIDSGNVGDVASIWKAVHVAIYKGNTEVDNIDLGGTSGSTTEVGKYLKLDDLNANTAASEYSIYVYVDGNDTDCTNANARKKLTDLKLSVVFSFNNSDSTTG